MKKVFLVLLLFVLWVVTVVALPMSGSYYVGANCNYTTLNSAISAVDSNGMADDVSLVILSLNAPDYYEQIVIDDLDTSGHLLTIKSEHEVVKAHFYADSPDSDNNYIIKIVDSDNIRFEYIHFESSETYGGLILLEGDCNNITFDNNIFRGRFDASGSYHNLLRMHAESGSQAPKNITITNNYFFDGIYQIYNNSSVSLSTLNTYDVIIQDNHFIGSEQNIYLQRSNSPVITKNSINGWNGIKLENCRDDIEIKMNDIYVNQNGIYVENSNDSATDAVIENNKIKSTGRYQTNSSLLAHGITLNSCNSFDVKFNTVVNYSQNSTSTAISIIGTRNYLSSNMLVNYGTGVGLNINNIELNTTGRNSEEYNNIYSDGITLVKVGNTSYGSMDEFLTNTYPEFFMYHKTYSYNPFFDDTDDFVTDLSFLDNLGEAQSDDFSVPLTDINEIVRNVDAPDIGAVEFDATDSFPMFGNYNVGSTASSYSTVSSVIDDLSSRGISSTTYINLANETFEEQIELSQITGAVGSDTLYFIGSEEGQTELQFEGTAQKNNVCEISRANNIYFRNINFINTSDTYSTSISFTSSASHIIFDNCSFKQNETATSSNSAGIFITTQGELHGLSVLNCTFDNGYRGFYDHSYVESSAIAIKNTVFNNHVRAIESNQTASIAIKDNKILNYNGYGIIVNSTFAVISKNRVAGLGTGITMISSTIESDRTRSYNIISNNYVTSNSGNMYCGINVSGNCVSIIHNSINLQGTNLRGIYSYSPSASTNIRGNAIRLEDGNVIELTHLPADNLTIDSNSYYTSGIKFVHMGDNNYYSLREWLEAEPVYNSKSVEADPNFTEIGTNYSPWLVNRVSNTSGVTVDFFGNPRDALHDIGAYEQTGAVFPFPGITSGELTVNTYGANYSSLQACFDDLATMGRQKWYDYPTLHEDTLYIKLADNTYSGNFKLNHIPREEELLENDGLSTIVIEPQTVYDWVQFEFPTEIDSQDPILTLNGVDNIIIRNVHFVGNDTKYTSLFSSTSRSNRIILDNCTFEVPENNNSMNLVSFESQFCRDITIKNCSFENAEYGMRFTKGYSSPNLENLEFSNNYFTGVTNPIYVNSSENTRIFENRMFDFSQGLSLYTLNGNTEVYKNRMSTRDFTGNVTNCSFINVYSDNAEEGLKFYNNILTSYNNSNQTNIGLLVQYCDNAKIYNNNIEIQHNYGYGWSRVAKFLQSESIDVKNNIFSGLDKTSSLYLGPNTSGVLANNCIYSENSYIAEINNQTYRTYEDLTEYWGYASTNISAYPFLDELGESKNYFLRLKAVEPLTTNGIDGVVLTEPYDIGASRINSYGLSTPQTGDITVGVGEYSTLEEAYELLMKRGISGDVRILMDSGEYDINYTLRYIPYSSEDNSLTITESHGAQANLSHNAESQDDNYILQLKGTRYLTLSNLGLSTNNESYATNIILNGLNDNLTIDGCSIHAYEYPNNYNNIDSALIDISYDNSKNVTVQNNHFFGGKYGIRSYYDSLAEDTIEFFKIHANTFVSNIFPISLEGVIEPTISSNNISLAKNSAISLRKVTRIYVINNNQVQILAGNALSIDDGDGFLSKYIYNNYFSNFGSGNFYDTVKLKNTNKVKMAYNTIKSSVSGNYSAFNAEQGVDDLEFVNNIVKTTGTGLAAEFNYEDEVAICNHNLFYSQNSTNQLKWGSSYINSSADLNETNMNTNSLFVDPMFNNNLATLQTTSPALNAGVGISYVVSSINGVERDSSPDLGAYEHEVVGNLEAPQNIQIYYDDNLESLHLSWDQVNNANSYKIYYSDRPNMNFEYLATTNELFYNFSNVGLKGFFKIEALPDQVRIINSLNAKK